MRQYILEKNAQVVISLQISCSQSVHKLLTSCARATCSQILKQVLNKLFTQGRTYQF